MSPIPPASQRGPTPSDLPARLLLGALAVAAFLPSLANGFVYDDEQYVLRNALTASWSGANLRAILSGPYFGNYHPLHLLLILAERTLFGLHPAPWHAVSLLLHAANTLLLASLLPRFGLPRPVALAGAAIFALHPVQAESVAWISEQKSLLSLLFTLLSLGAYLRARSSGAKAPLALALGAFAAALGAKVAAIGLVPVLFVLETLPQASLGPARGRALGRLLPFVALAGVWCNFAIGAHGRAGFIHPYPGGSLPTALLSIAPVLVAYAKNLLWPVHLSAAYDLPPASDMAPLELAAAWALVLMALLAVSRAAWTRRSGALGVGLVWVAGFLLPVLNLVPIGTLMNDRYLYAPLCALGPMLAAGGAAVIGVARDRSARVPAPAGALLVAALLALIAGASAVRSGVWRDEERIWTDATIKSPRSAHARYNLGTLWLERGHLEQAERELRAARALDPASPRPYVNLGTIHYRRGRYRLATAEFEAAAKLAPRDFEVWMNLASAQARAGRDEAAIASLRRAEALRPASGRPPLGIGLLLARSGDAPGARRAFRHALSARDLDAGKLALVQARLRDLELRNGDQRERRGAAQGLQGYPKSHGGSVIPRAHATEDESG